MRRAGLTGNPVDHSLSPVMHNAAFRALGIDAVYELWPATLDELSGIVGRIRQPDYLGANVTVPHKVAAYDLVDELSESATKILAVNTIIPVAGRLVGDNTDAYGFATSVRESTEVPASGAGVVLGAGGASAAILVAMADMGIAPIYLANRTEQRARDLAAALAIPSIQVISLEAIADYLPDANLIVNATSVGWHDDAMPISPSSMARLPRTAVAVDLTYRETAFLAAARRAGLVAIDGLGMLVHQGARSFTLWTGIAAPVEVMRAAAVAEQKRRAG